MMNPDNVNQRSTMLRDSHCSQVSRTFIAQWRFDEWLTHKHAHYSFYKRVKVKDTLYSSALAAIEMLTYNNCNIFHIIAWGM